MPILTIGTRRFDVSDERVAREAEWLFKLSPARRALRVTKAKSELAKAGGAAIRREVEESPAAKRAAAILLSQGISEI
jgi:hypothetical protein